jgi:siroheme synthase
MMAVGTRGAIVARLLSHGWSPERPAAIVCGASTPDAWTWTGTLGAVESANPPAGIPGVLVIGEVVQVRDALLSAANRGEADEVKYGRQ